MPRITVIGAGYVGLVSATCFAELGHQVSCVELDEEKVRLLRGGAVPILEPRLQDLWSRHTQRGVLEITADYAAGLVGTEFVFICVGTPSLPDGRANVRYIVEAARSLATHVDGRPIIVIKSTVPVGTADLVSNAVNAGRREGQRMAVVSNPEFLREGQAVHDFLEPDRVVIGAEQEAAARSVAALYGAAEAPLFITDNATAEMIKYASNAFLATKVSFINEFAALCEPLGVDVEQVAKGLGMDKRIGPAFLSAGLGWGGSCLPKDTRALLSMAKRMNTPAPLLSAVVRINARQPRNLVHELSSLLGTLEGKQIAVWGLTFKPETDDLRESPAIALIQLLLERGCRVRAYDPAVTLAETGPHDGIEYCSDPYEATRGADALVLATAWQEFLSLNMSRVREEMGGRIVLDARNALDADNLRRLGFVYRGIGRNGAHAGAEDPSEGKEPAELGSLPAHAWPAGGIVARSVPVGVERSLLT